MSLINSKAGLPYEQWVQRDPLQKQTLSTRASRNVALKESLVPFKTPVNDAVRALELQLKRIDQGLSEFLQAEKAALELSTRHAALFRDLQIPAQLTRDDGKALLREYVNLATKPANSHATVEQIVSALCTLRTDIEPRFQAEQSTRAEVVSEAKQELIALIADHGPLNALRALVDADSVPAERVFAGLIKGLNTLKELLTSSPIGETQYCELLRCIHELEQSFDLLRGATAAYSAPDLPMSSDQLLLADLPRLYRSLGFGLPTQAFEDPHADLHALSSDEKQAYLVVTRHLDVLTGDEENSSKFIEIAIQERDRLLEDMIRRLEISGAGSLIASQARRFSAERPDLSDSLDTLIIRANERLEDEFVQIQCKAQVGDEIARYLARQRFDAGDLGEILELLASCSELERVVATILRAHTSMPTVSARELRDHLEELANVLSLVRDISPILKDSIVRTPGRELASIAGVRCYREELELLKCDPERLRAQEISTVISITAALLEEHFPCAGHVSAQYLVAAQIVVLGFAPQIAKGQVDRPIRDCRGVVSLVARACSTPPSIPIVHETIHSHLIPHLLVWKNHSEKNPVKRLYQLQRIPPEELRPVVAHLEYIANHPLAARKKGNANQIASTARQNTARQLLEKQGKAKHVDPAEQLRLQQQARDRAVVDLGSFLGQCQRELAVSIQLASSLTDTVEQLQGLLDKLSPLSARLSSSLRNGLTFQEQTNYKSEFEKGCFSKLRQRVGFNPLGISTKGQKTRAKRMNSHDVTEHVVDCILQTAPDAHAVLEAGKKTRGMLREVEEHLSAPALSFLQGSFATIRARVAACLAATSRSESERATALASCVGIVSDPEPFIAVQRALQELADELQRKTKEAASSSTILPAETESDQDQSQPQGGAHGNN